MHVQHQHTLIILLQLLVKRGGEEGSNLGVMHVHASMKWSWIIA